MIEWSQSNKYNPMNSDKGLTYYEHYQRILGWMDGQKDLPPPIEASLDPTSACNNKCYYCSSNRYLSSNTTRWGWDYLEEVLCHLAEWGVKALCWGGRESTLNPHLAEANRMAKRLGIETAIVTNGVNISGELMESLLFCKWIGISVDTTSPEIYKQVRGTDDCEKVWENISILGARKTTTTVGVRALILPETVNTLYDVCLKTRESGATFCHIRPADLERQDLHIAQKLNIDMEKIQRIFTKCHELETPSFSIYTVTHKYNENFHTVHRFKHCLASPLVIQICADKKMYLCVDHRMDARYEIKEWGSDQHRELIKSIVPDRDCSRCTWSSYNQQMEQVVLEDKMHRNFP